MIVVTEKGFVRLTGCYQVVVVQTEVGLYPRWTVGAIWAYSTGEAPLHETADEAEAHRIADALAEVAAGDTGDKERRIDVRELVEWHSAK